MSLRLLIFARANATHKIKLFCDCNIRFHSTCLPILLFVVKMRPYYNTTYPPENMEAAIEAVRTGGSVYASAKQFGVPRKTLSDKIQRLHPNPNGRPKVFSDVEEQTFAGMNLRIFGPY